MRFLETIDATKTAKNKAFFDVYETSRDSLKRRLLVQLAIFMVSSGVAWPSRRRTR